MLGTSNIASTDFDWAKGMSYKSSKQDAVSSHYMQKHHSLGSLV